MKKLFLPTLLFIIICACSKDEKPEKDDGLVKVGKIDSIYSKSLNEERKFWVYLPYGVGKQPEPGKKYPVLYLLDGDAHFQSVTGLIQQLSTVNGNMRMPEMIVVAIPNTDRTRDLTTSHVDGEYEKTSGGAENFTRFLGELITHIEGIYPVTSYRTLIGHSLGGLVAINTLMHHRDMFTNYLAIDPSMWWDDQKLLKESKHILDTSRFDKKFLYVAMAHTVTKGMTLKEVVIDTAENSKHMRSINEFCEYARGKTSNGLTFESRYYPDDNHSSVVLISEHDALRSMFSWYEPAELEDFYYARSGKTPGMMIEAIKSHYAKVSDHYGYEVIPDEAMVDEMGYYFMEDKKTDFALALFNLNAANYPKNVSSFDALGDYYIHEKDTARAIENYEKGLAIEKDKGVSEKLAKLKK